MATDPKNKQDTTGRTVNPKLQALKAADEAAAKKLSQAFAHSPNANRPEWDVKRNAPLTVEEWYAEKVAGTGKADSVYPIYELATLGLGAAASKMATKVASNVAKSQAKKSLAKKQLKEAIEEGRNQMIEMTQDPQFQKRVNAMMKPDQVPGQLLGPRSHSKQLFENLIIKEPFIKKRIKALPTQKVDTKYNIFDKRRKAADEVYGRYTSETVQTPANIVDKMVPEVYVNPKGPKPSSTTFHEFTHFLTDGHSGLSNRANNLLSDVIDQDMLNVYRKHAAETKNDDLFNHLTYLTQPTEIHARLNEIRKLRKDVLGKGFYEEFTPDETLDMIQLGVDKKVVSPVFKELMGVGITDAPKVREALNKMFTPAAIAASVTAKKSAEQGK